MRVLASISVPAILFVTLWQFVPDLTSGIRLPECCVSITATPTEKSANEPSAGTSNPLSLERYDDLDYGFSVAVPAGWSKIVLGESAEQSEIEFATSGSPLWSEPGYTVGFESPRGDKPDQFADYILIEVLPGDDTGLFDTTQADQRVLHVGHQSIDYDQLFVDSEKDDTIDVDLVIFQRGVQALGYTLSFYAIGEPANEQALFDAFQIMLRTFYQSSEPFVII